VGGGGVGGLWGVPPPLLSHAGLATLTIRAIIISLTYWRFIMSELGAIIASIAVIAMFVAFIIDLANQA